MTNKPSTGCLPIIFFLIFSAILGFIGKFIPLKYVFIGFIILAIILWFTNSETRNSEREKLKAQKQAAEDKRRAHRDADTQETPYLYRCSGHPNNTLAIRYGIANLKEEIKEYWYTGKGGEALRNPGRDKIILTPSESILIRKIKRVHKDRFLAELPDFGDRKVIVVIEDGTESVKTFYPLDDSWFQKHADLENVLKDNKTFTLKELARFHVEKTVRGVT